MSTPLERYQQDLKKPDFSEDKAQAEAVGLLDELYHELVSAQQNEAAVGLLRRVFGRFSNASEQPAPRGLYFWGGVGRGKTYLMDTFYECLPFERKLRAHFHRFMLMVHRELKACAGEKNPLRKVADDIANRAAVICFDEFFVKDITDAMILAGLFERLFERGVVLVATSNIVPEELYKDGLQRARFLPAIDLIKTHTRVVNVDGGVDYRLRTLEQAELYHFPLDDAAYSSLAESFERLSPEPGHRDVDIEIEGRSLRMIAMADDVAWFDFYTLCDGPRSQNDYIELAQIFHAVLISNVPKMGAQHDDLARRFINLVDEFYDRGVKLVMSAEVALDDLYSGGRLEFEFERTVSRLLEMQSHEYLARAHRA